MSSSITVISVINVEHETSFRKSLEFLLRRKLFRFFFFYLLPFVSAVKYMLKVFKIVQVYFDRGNCYLFIYFLEILQISCVFGNLLNLSRNFILILYSC